MSERLKQLDSKFGDFGILYSLMAPDDAVIPKTNHYSPHT